MTAQGWVGIGYAAAGLVTARLVYAKPSKATEEDPS